MSKLEKGQTITKTSEETAVELDGEIRMDAKLIGKFITQQVAVTMAEKSKEYEKKIKKLEKGRKDKVPGKSSPKTVRWAVDAPPRKRNHPRLKHPPILVLLINLRLNWHKAEIVSSESHCKEDPNKPALPAAVRPKEGKRKKTARSKSASKLTFQTSKTTSAKLRGRSKKR